MRYFLVLFVLLFQGQFSIKAFSLSDVDYTTADSVQVVQWLEEAREQYVKTDRMLFFAKKFLGRPYVGGVLDRNDNEKLVVNLKELDCATLVENVTALSLTAGRGSTSFFDFCEALERIRYTQGIRSGYASRNHYFSEWIRSNSDMGLLVDLFDERYHVRESALAPLTLKINYMSRNFSQYPLLRKSKDARKQISAKEQAISGSRIWYLPKEKIAMQTQEQKAFREGDIVAFVTRKSGLDIAHVGVLCYQEGEWHFIHASSLRKKVVIDPLALSEYLKKQPMFLGIRVLRVH